MFALLVMALLWAPCWCLPAPAAAAAPGGYTGIGGIHSALQLHPETHRHALRAARLSFEHDESLDGDEPERSHHILDRSPHYIPTFFTGSEEEFRANRGPQVRRRQAHSSPYSRFQAPAWNSWLADHLDQADHSPTIYLLFILNKVISGLFQKSLFGQLTSTLAAL